MRRADVAGALAYLAHELRTPLSAIAALAEVMRDERLGPIGGEGYRRYAAGIHDSAHHALSLVTGMAETTLGQPRVASGTARVSLTALAASCVTALEPLAAGRSIGLRAARGDEDAIVEADARSVRQIVLNLVSNALQAAPPGGEVVVATDVTGGGAPCLIVADTGPGMRPEDAARLLGPSDAPAGTAVALAAGAAVALAAGNPPQPRTGLGLPLVRALAAANGATVAVASAPETGTTITLTFPAPSAPRRAGPAP